MFKILINTIIGLVLIFIWSRFVDLGQILQTLAKTNFIFLGPVFFFLLLSPIIRAFRLQIFLAEIKKVKILDLIFLNGAAQIFNFFIPIRAGELIKGVYLNTNYQLPLGKSVIWIFLDRFVDFLVVLLMAAVLFFLVPTALSITVINIIIVILVLALLLTYLIVFQQKLARELFKKLRNLLIFARAKSVFDKLTGFILDSFAILNRHPKDLAVMIILTVLAYGADAAAWYFTFLALGVDLGFLKMYLGQVLSALTYLIPAAPGYVGSAEASGLLILSGLFGVSANLASAMIVLFHVCTAIFFLIFGLISIYLLKINAGSLLKRAFKARQQS